MTLAPLSAVLCTVVLCALVGGCQAPMYSGTPEDMSGAMAPAYAPGTYDPPAKVGGTREEESASTAVTRPTGDEKTYEYRGGRDPITGRAKIQM